MSPTISPSSTRSARSCTARRPPTSFVRPSVSRSAILQGPACPRSLHGDRLHLLEARPLHLVEVDHAASHVSLVLERASHAEDGLVAFGVAAACSDTTTVTLSVLIHR